MTVVSGKLKVGLSLMANSSHNVARRPAAEPSGMLDGASYGARLGDSKEGVSNGDRTRNPRSHSPVLLGAEEWRPIPGMDGRYEASSLGRIRSTGQYHRRGYVVLKAHMARGYETVHLERRHVYVHGLVARTFIGERPHGHQVNHIDLDRLNNRPENLEYVTPAENALHARALRPWSPFRRCADCGMTALMHRPDKAMGCPEFVPEKKESAA